MSGWRIPPPKEPTKSREEFDEERKEKVSWLISQGYIRSEGITKAMLKVRREEFIPVVYKDRSAILKFVFVQTDSANTAFLKLDSLN